MRIRTVTFTGADDGVDPSDLLSLSLKYPFVEWGILISWKRYGTPRYPSPQWIDQLALAQRVSGNGAFAAHLCGDAMRDAVRVLTDPHPAHVAEWMLPIGISPDQYDQLFARTQLNFDVDREGLTEVKLTALMRAWRASRTGILITQHNEGNAGIWSAFQAGDLGGKSSGPKHQILMDASGGRERAPESWPRPITGVACGYAGGIGPETIVADLDRIAQAVGDGIIWIDMEGRVRDAQDRFDLNRVETVLRAVRGRVL
jgi:hypothetical protein